jgi:amidase
MRVLMESDDPELVHGQPVSLQLVARRLEEEKLLAMAETITSLL